MRAGLLEAGVGNGAIAADDDGIGGVQIDLAALRVVLGDLVWVRIWLEYMRLVVVQDLLWWLSLRLWTNAGVAGGGTSEGAGQARCEHSRMP